MIQANVAISPAIIYTPPFFPAQHLQAGFLLIQSSISVSVAFGFQQLRRCLPRSRLFFQFHLVPLQIPFSLFKIRNRNQQANVHLLQCLHEVNLLRREIRANALALFDAVCLSELLCRHSSHDPVYHIAFIAEMIWLGVVMQQLDVLCQQWELFPCQNQCADKTFHLVEPSNVEFLETCCFLAVNPIASTVNPSRVTA